MRLGFSTLACPDWDIETIAGRGPAMGYEAVELQGAALAAVGSDQGAAARLRGAGLDVACLATNGETRQTDDKRKAAVESAIEVAGRIGCPCVRIRAWRQSPRQSREASLLRMADALREMCPRAAAAGVSLLLENTKDVVSRDIWFVVDAVGHPALRCCWNTRESAMAGEGPTFTVPRLSRLLSLVHVGDARIADGVAMQHVLPGEGDANVARAIELLHGVIYGGTLVFEWPRAEVPSLAPPEEALPAGFAKLKAVLDGIAATKELSAYKGDKNAPKFASPRKGP